MRRTTLPLTKRARLVPFALLVTGCAGAPPRPGLAPNPWAQLAAADVEATRRNILDDHPGPVDPANPSFRIWLEGGYREALAGARRVRDFGGYAAVLRRYVAGFRDGHLGLSFGLAPTAQRWPGFTVGLVGGEYVVRESTQGPPAGAALVACDGRSPADLMAAWVFPFYGDPRLESSWVRHAPKLFADAGNPLRELPRRCEFRGVGPADLAWRPVEARELDEKLTRAAFGPTPAAGVRELAGGTFWVSLPSFATDAATAATLKGIIARAPSWRKAPRVVFDLRGNTGGSSSWGAELARALWGEAYVDAARANASVGRPAVSVDWRASANVQAHVEGLAAELAAALDADDLADLKATAKGIAGARAAGRPYFTEGSDPPPPAAVPLPTPATRARVYFVTDARCASACLDFVDVLLALPGVVHVGQPTGADTAYMDVRRAPLPGGVAELWLATKVWRNRPRGERPCVPAHRFAGDVGDTRALETWLSGLAI
jgi:hypothetical protein